MALLFCSSPWSNSPMGCLYNTPHFLTSCSSSPLQTGFFFLLHMNCCSIQVSKVKSMLPDSTGMFFPYLSLDFSEAFNKFDHSSLETLFFFSLSLNLRDTTGCAFISTILSRFCWLTYTLLLISKCWGLLGVGFLSSLCTVWAYEMPWFKWNYNVCDSQIHVPCQDLSSEFWTPISGLFLDTSNWYMQRKTLYFFYNLFLHNPTKPILPIMVKGWQNSQLLKLKF